MEGGFVAGQETVRTWTIVGPLAVLSCPLPIPGGFKWIPLEST